MHQQQGAWGLETMDWGYRNFIVFLLQAVSKRGKFFMEEICVSHNKGLTEDVLFTENRTQKHSKAKVEEITL